MARLIRNRESNAESFYVASFKNDKDVRAVAEPSNEFAEEKKPPKNVQAFGDSDGFLNKGMGGLDKPIGGLNGDESKEIPWVKSPNGRLEIYTNMCHLTWSLDDVRVRIAQLISEGRPGGEMQTFAEERATVTFTWRGAKMLRDQLSNIISKYEQENGEIQVSIKLPQP